MFRDSVAAVVAAVMHMRPRAIPLAMITMRKSTHGFPFLSYMSMGLCLVALWAARSSTIIAQYTRTCFEWTPCIKGTLVRIPGVSA